MYPLAKKLIVGYGWNSFSLGASFSISTFTQTDLFVCLTCIGVCKPCPASRAALEALPDVLKRVTRAKSDVYFKHNQIQKLCTLGIFEFCFVYVRHATELHCVL